MAVTFHSQVQADDWFRFNMRHYYTSVSGISMTIAGVLLFIAGIAAHDRLPFENLVLFMALDVMFLIYTPIQLKTKSKLIMASNPTISGKITYTLEEDGITVETEVSDADEDNKAFLPYDQIYKVILTKQQLLIYSSRVNAYIIPRRDIESELNDITEALRSKLEAYKINF